MLHRLKNSATTSKSNSKSLGDSLKRHLFQKFSSTPSASSTNTVIESKPPHICNFLCIFYFHQTPNRFQQKPTKSRVLFQSPATATVATTTTVQLEPLKTTTCTATSTQVTIAVDEKQTENQIPTKKSVEFKRIVSPLLHDNSDKLNTTSETDLHRSRFKSEPNLSTILREPNISSIASISSKLGKGASMFNLTIQQSIMDKTKSKSEENMLVSKCANDFQSPIDVQEVEEDLDDPDFEESEDDDDQADEHTPVNFYSTRQSMSPITKSTQRMSKAMQESIMTPRSRKPLMLPGMSLLSKAETNVTTVTATDTEPDSLTTSFR